MNDLINKERLMEALGISDDCVDCQHRLNGLCLWKPNMADVCEIITEMPSAEPKRKTGKWLEKKVTFTPEDGFALQSCKCSECGRYDTSPYMYYFSEPHYCSWCGARMKGEKHE